MLASWTLGIAMVAAFLLAAGGIAMIRRHDRKRGGLMIAAATVLVANVAIWTV